MASTTDRDALRAQVAARGLTPDAAAALTPVVSGLSLEQLGPVKQLLKRFFSDGPWTDADDAALADAVGSSPGEPGRVELAPDLTLSWGWHSGRFRLDLAGGAGDPAPDRDPEGATPDLDALFAGTVVPEVTPSPRTIRFATPPLGDGPSRSFTADTAATDPRVERVFAAADGVTDVLVGPDFVAVTILHADRWEQVLPPLLQAVETEFAEPAGDTADRSGAAAVMTFDVGSSGDAPSPGRVERAWSELGMLHADRGEHLDRILAASRDVEPARRQVAAALLADAPHDIAARAWSRLATDRSRAVRRSTVDALVDAQREDLRPVLEHALADADGWVRWKAVHGLAALGIAPSRAAVMEVATDPDFRVRLEATRALAGS